MPPPAYSVRIFAGSVPAGGSVTVGPPPSGKRWVLNRWVYVPTTTAAGRILAFVPGPYYLLDDVYPIPGQGALYRDAHEVINDGETFEITASPDSDWSVVLSGFEFFVN